MPAHARTEALHALATHLVSDTTLAETLHKVAVVTTAVIEGAEFAGITMEGGAGPRTAVFTADTSPEIDEAQYRSGRGPCLDAWRTGTIVRVDDLSQATDRYPEFSAAARAHGIESTLSFGLVSGGDSLGALNLYASRPRAFTEDDEVLGSDLVAVASAVLANAYAYQSAVDLSEDMAAAMRTRAVIEQAKGILMGADESLSAEDAFDLLRRRSQNENVKLRDIAQRVVDRRPPQDPAATT